MPPCDRLPSKEAIGIRRATERRNAETTARLFQVTVGGPSDAVCAGARQRVDGRAQAQCHRRGFIFHHRRGELSDTGRDDGDQTLFHGRYAIGARVNGQALVAHDGLSARYGLDRIRCARSH